MDYGEMLAEHVNTGADFTVACMTVNVEQAAKQFGVMGVDEKTGWNHTHLGDHQGEPTHHLSTHPTPLPLGGGRRW